MMTGLWTLHPGHCSDRDIHPDADEIYYVVNGAGKLTLGNEEYTVHKGMTVFIPANVGHQSFNNGSEDLVYYYIFAPPPQGPSKQEAQGWVRIR
jgi:mannose-6-phosphate isomerase-like protein (cupin superfamily)